MLTEQEPGKKTSWEQLREQSSNLWNSARQNGDRTRFGHPDELAEHVVFRIASYIVNSSNDLTDEIRKLLKRGGHEEVINIGQKLYENQNQSESPLVKPSIIQDTLKKALEKKTN